jgi:2,3-bisphosphoglycerate-independent phosphoglycerate mutase
MKNRAMLIILDGFGEGEKDMKKNAVYAASTPYIDNLKKVHPWSTLETGGASVGVLPGQAGGSDIGHNTIGAGRVIRQPIKIIYDAIKDKTFFSNLKLLESIEYAKKNNSYIHLFGIGSDSSLHAHTHFIYALLDLLKQEEFPGEKVFLHLVSDGRDTPPQSAIDYFDRIEAECNKREIGKIASVVGRFYLDRGGIWKRTKVIYDLLTSPLQKYKNNWKDYIRSQYKKGTNDQFVEPMAFGSMQKIYPRITHNDVCINFNFRADRERQITESLKKENFTHFERQHYPENLYYIGMIQYSPDFQNVYHAFEQEKSNICLSEVISQKKLKQMHIAGKEKIIFIHYNLNGCQETEIEGEVNITVPQTKEVDDFEKNPEMSAPNLTKAMMKSLKEDIQDVYIINYENCDQVGHTGDFNAAIKAVESVDTSLSSIIPEALKKGFEVIVTADHGNADEMIYKDGTPHMAHSHNPVPCIFISEKRQASIKNGTLADIAPTILNMLNIPSPKDFTGKSLIS